MERAMGVAGQWKWPKQKDESWYTRVSAKKIVAPQQFKMGLRTGAGSFVFSEDICGGTVYFSKYYV